MIGMLLGAFVLGGLADRIGRRNGLVVAQSIMALGCLLCSFSPNYSVFLALRFVTGFGSIAVFAIAFILSKYYDKLPYRCF